MHANRHAPARTLSLLLLGLLLSGCIIHYEEFSSNNGRGVDLDRDLPIKRPIDLTADIPTPAVNLDADNVWGNITITSAPTVSRLHITGILREKTPSEATITFDPTGPHIASNTDPHARFGDITIEVPPGTDLAISSSSGDIKARQLALTKIVHLHSNYGNVALSDTAAINDLKLTSSSGNVSAANLDATASAELHSSYGDISLDTAPSIIILKLSTSSGKITASHLKSFHEATMASAYGDLRLTDLTGDSPTAPLKISTSSGHLHLTDIHAATLTARSSYGNVTLDTATDLPSVYLQSSSGDVTATNLTRAGDLNLNSSYGNARLTSIPAAKSISIHCASGNITLTNVAAPTANLNTNYGDINLDSCAFDSLQTHTGSGQLKQSNVRVNGTH